MHRILNLTKFNNGKYKVLHVGKNNPMYQQHAGGHSAENTLAYKGLGVLVDTVDQRLKMKETVWTARNTFSLCEGWLSTATGCQERLWSLHLCRWTAWTACSKWPSLSRGAVPDNHPAEIPSNLNPSMVLEKKLHNFYMRFTVTKEGFFVF